MVFAKFKLLGAGGCLEGLWRVSRGCLECVWKVSGGCLEGVWMMSGRCLDPNFLDQIMVFAKFILIEAGGCLEGVWRVSRVCLEGGWMVSGECLDDVWKVPGSKLFGPIFFFDPKFVWGSKKICLPPHLLYIYHIY